MLTNDLHAVKKNFWYLAGSEVLNKGLLFITVVYLGRTLGVESFGLLNFGQALMLFFLLGVDLGTEWLGVKETAQMRQKGDPDSEINLYIVELTCYRLMLGVLMAPLYLLAAWVSTGSGANFRMFLFFALYVFSTSFLIEWVFSGRQTMQYVALGRLVRSGLYCGIVLVTVRGPQDVVAAALSYWLSFAVSALVLIWLFAKTPLDLTSVRLRPRRLLRVIGASVPIIFFVLLQLQSFYSIDIILIQIGLGPVPAGAFGAVVRVTSVALQLSLLVTSSFFPLLARMGSNEESRVVSSHLAVRIFSVMLPIALFAFILNRQILGSIFGSAYGARGDSVGGLYLTAPLFQLAIVYANALVAWDQQKAMMRIVLGASVFNVVLGAIAIRFGSISGLIAVTFLSLVATNYLLIRVGRMTFPIYGILWRMTLGCGTASLVAVGLRSILETRALPSVAAASLVALGAVVTVATYLYFVHGREFWQWENPAAIKSI